MAKAVMIDKTFNTLSKVINASYAFAAIPYFIGNTDLSLAFLANSFSTLKNCAYIFAYSKLNSINKVFNVYDNKAIISNIIDFNSAFAHCYN
jgi:hypothetical protein